MSYMQYEDESGALMMLPADMFLLLDKVILACLSLYYSSKSYHLLCASFDLVITFTSVLSGFEAYCRRIRKQ